MVPRTRHETTNPRRRFARASALAAILLLMLAAVTVACSAETDDDAPTSSDTVTGSTGGLGASGFDSSESPRGEDGAAVAPVPSAGEGSTNLPSSLGRTIIRNGSVDIVVESVPQAFDRVRQLVETAGGFVASSDFRGTGEYQSASLTLRVPAGQFGDIVASLEEMATEVLSVTSNSQDVTEEFTDLESSLRNLRAVEQQYLTLLGEARTINDILLVQDRLTGVRNDIERIQGRLNLLSSLADLATINVSLSPVSAETETGEKDFGDRIADAWESSLSTLSAIGTGIAVVVVWSWWLAPILAIVGWIGWRNRGRLEGRARPQEPERVDTPEDAT